MASIFPMDGGRSVEEDVVVGGRREGWRREVR
jgi:hypothetical protein